MTLSRTAISRMDYTKSPRYGSRDTPFGSGIHHKASQENDVWDNVMVGIDVGRETCIRDKDMDPKYQKKLLLIVRLLEGKWLHFFNFLGVVTNDPSQRSFSNFCQLICKI